MRRIYLHFAPINQNLPTGGLARPFLGQDDQTESIESLLKAISKRTGETCHFSELTGIETILTRRAKGQQLVAIDFKIGTRCKLHATSVGKAILAYQNAQFIQDYTTLDLARYTDFAKSDPKVLLEELSVGMNCVAVPIEGVDDKMNAGVSIAGPTLRLTQDRLVELANTMRDEISLMRAY